MDLHERELEKVIGELPEDVRARVLQKRRDDLTYASSV